MLVANPLNPTCVHPLLDSTHEHTLFWLAEPPFPLALHRRVALFLACTTVTSALPGIKNGNAELSLSAPSSQPPPVCNGPCYAAHTTSWSIKCVPGYLHGCHGCPECQSPPSTPPFPPLTPGGALLTEVDVVLTVRNITAKAFNGDGTGVDYRTLLTERYFVPLLGLQPNATWSNPIDGQREASVTFGPAKDLPSTVEPRKQYLRPPFEWSAVPAREMPSSPPSRESSTKPSREPWTIPNTLPISGRQSRS